jgi:3-dehydro-L-gulonate 2-dehydrogenase
MRVPYLQLKTEFKRILTSLSLSEQKADLCASIFASNSLDGVYSHGINRFPGFVADVKDGLIDIHVEPELLTQNGVMEVWNGHLGPGIYNANKAMDRAIELSKQNGIGCVAMHHTNHWMRGGTYGWQAADAGCIGICFSNTIANMPPWGGKEPRLGNNPLVIAVPRENGHIVLDMAMSQFSYGKLEENEVQNKELSVAGGYDEMGNLSSSPSAIIKSQRALPIGFWKGSGLSFILDVLLTALTGGLSVARISSAIKEAGVSQFFLSIHQQNYHQQLIEEIIEYTKSSDLVYPGEPIRYPGERTLEIRHKNKEEGIPINEIKWKEILEM